MEPICVPCAVAPEPTIEAVVAVCIPCVPPQKRSVEKLTTKESVVETQIVSVYSDFVLKLLKTKTANRSRRFN